MSTIARNSRHNTMSAPSLHEFKKQASFFFKEKIKTARLALTDVTPAQLLTEEATKVNGWAPDTKTLGSISRAAFEIDDFWRIVGILHQRLSKFDRKNWRVSYNSLIVLEHLLTHGPESAAEEFQSDKQVIKEMESFQHIDEKGFNWGLTVRKKSERILKLLEKGPIYKEEREKARKLTRGIQGFGSFCQRTSSGQGIPHESPAGAMERCNSTFNDHSNQDNQLSSLPNETFIKPEQSKERKVPEACKKTEKLNTRSNCSNGQILGQLDTRISFKENITPSKEELHNWSCTLESNPLLGNVTDGQQTGFPTEDDHPFNDLESQSNAPLVTAIDEILQGC